MPHRTILFADVCNSTGITEAIGDAESREFIGELLAELSVITEAQGGGVVKTIGDEIMSSFETPLQGISAAVDMQRAINARPPFAGMKTAIRVGLHAGPVIIENDDVFGDVVNVSARIAGLSAADQVLTTLETIQAAGDQALPHRSLGVHGVKGRDEQLNLCEVLWRGETAQMTVVAPKLELGPKPELEIVLGKERRSLESETGSTLSIGRGAECDLVVPIASASRAHANLMCRAGRFYLEDHSTNGTYVRPEGEREMFVHRDQVLLQGAGLIRLGEPIAVKGPLDIEYRTLYQD